MPRRASTRLLKIHLRAALVAAGGDFDRATRTLGLTSDDAARLLGSGPSVPPRPGQTSGTYVKIGAAAPRKDDDDDERGPASA